MKQKSLLLVTVLILILGLTIGGQAAPKQQAKKAAPKEQPKTGGTLVFGQGKEFTNPNPFVNTTSSFQFVKETAYESLLTYNDDEKIVPGLAESYDVSTGGTEFTFRLHKGVKFHNGKEMKADDVVWSANHVKDPKNGAFGQNTIKDVKSVEKIDDYTVKFTLASPSVLFLSNMATIRMLPIVAANSLRPGQLKLEANTFAPGTGPFMFEQYQPGFETILKKSPDYWGGPAYLDKLVFRPITDDANRFNALRSGDAQMADRISSLDASRVKKGEVKGIVMIEEPFGGYNHLLFNSLSPLLQKKEMRQAIAYAIDKKRIVDEIFYGAARPTDIMMDPQGVWGKAANLPAQKRNLAKAKELLKAADYKGQDLVLIGRKQDAQFNETFQRMLGEAGIKVKIDILESGVYKDRYVAGKYDLYIAGGTITADPVLTMSEHFYTVKMAKGRYSSPKVDKLFDDLGAEFDQKKRLQLFKDLASTLYVTDVGAVPLCFDIRYVGMSEKVRGYGPPAGKNYREGSSGNYFKRVWLN